MFEPGWVWVEERVSDSSEEGRWVDALSTPVFSYSEKRNEEKRRGKGRKAEEQRGKKRGKCIN